MDGHDPVAGRFSLLCFGIRRCAQLDAELKSIAVERRLGPALNEAQARHRRAETLRAVSHDVHVIAFVAGPLHVRRELLYLSRALRGPRYHGEEARAPSRPGRDIPQLGGGAWFATAARATRSRTLSEE